jgi:phosphopantothenoylcysteine decarboxylase / phosphopantothenate---cysteine ligase
MSLLANKRVLLGVSGGIAAYKAAELVRLLRAENVGLKVVMTRSAAEFVAPLTFQALSGQPVSLELLDAHAEAAMGHIDLARWADRILIAPATADFIAKLRIGIADELLTAVCLAAEAPIVLVPAMNRVMWHNPATQDNVECLRNRGIKILGPMEGAQACGETGLGRMMEPADVCSALAAAFGSGILNGISVLVTAGPTREAIDPVRYISNRSSGKMGYAVAEAAAEAGAEVTLVTGPVSLSAPDGMAIVQVESAREMYQAVMERVGSQAIYIGAAAVADYHPAAVQTKKIKKGAVRPQITLERTDDILAAVAQLDDGPFTVGFAAETDNLEQYAQRKLQDKALGMIAANWVGRSDGGFDRDENALTVFWRNGQRQLPMARKRVVAKQLIELIGERFYANKQ